MMRSVLRPLRSALRSRWSPSGRAQVVIPSGSDAPAESLEDSATTSLRAQSNAVYGAALTEAATLRYVAHSVPHSPSSLLLGSPTETTAVAAALIETGRHVASAVWTWNDQVPPFDGVIVICKSATNAEEWEGARKVRRDRLLLLHELALPFTPVRTALLTYGFLRRSSDRDPLDQAVRWYLGLDAFGPLAAVEELMPLRGRTVIEFGPLDGFQTAALHHHGVASITCIEARPENALKVLAARHAFHWQNVDLVVDDFHNTSAELRGRFDVAWAHGVYYHSIAPFLFLESLLEVARDVFIGGFCATDSLPDGPTVVLEHRGSRYRAKAYHESGDFMSGVNRTGYFLYGSDLIRFFESAGCRVTVVTDSPSTSTAGQYLRFVARQ